MVIETAGNSIVMLEGSHSQATVSYDYLPSQAVSELVVCVFLQGLASLL